MWRVILYLCGAVCLGMCAKPGPKFPPTKGEVWPKPQKQTKTNTAYFVALISFNVTNHDCPLLRNVISRYETVFSYMEKLRLRLCGYRCSGQEPDVMPGTNEFVVLRVNLTGPCEQYPQLHMDENYTLTVAESSELTSASIWGAMRGLETFSHLLYFTDDYKNTVINKTHIVDYPRYPHRGLLIDSGRHFLRVENILRILDAMAMNKMNVLHWHIVDDESFPYQSQKFPELSKAGAYHSTMVYTGSDIESIIEYATERGIRVLPEFDVPGHTRSWGRAHPELLTSCGDSTVGPMNPIQNTTYNFIRDLYNEVIQRYPDEYVHIGGDEVDFECWLKNKDIQQYMKNHNISNGQELQALFMKNVMGVIPAETKIVAWQEVFNVNVKLPKQTIIQVWMYHPETYMKNVLSAGYNVLFSSFWYLDTYLNYNFAYMYKMDPRSMVYNITHDESLLNHVLGGEACMWGEMVDDSNLMTTVWPRANAVAEVLWSPREESEPAPKTPYRRAEEHACRMARRGLRVAPTAGPGFCLL